MKNISRRSFLKTGAVAAAGLTIVPGSVLGKSFGYTAPSDKLNIAGIGVGGMGRRNLANMNTENIVALCDVDWHYAETIRRLNALKTGVSCSMRWVSPSTRLW